MTKKKVLVAANAKPVHAWFGLSYANYLVMPRAVLQSMPPAWQEKFVKLLAEAEAACVDAGIPGPPSYRVRAVDEEGRFTRDEIPHYRHAPNLFTEH
jgi:hypothetical protein